MCRVCYLPFEIAVRRLLSKISAGYNLAIMQKLPLMQLYRNTDKMIINMALIYTPNNNSRIIENQEEVMISRFIEPS